MNYDLKKPCDGCPFRREAAPGWLGDYTAPEIVQMARNGQNFLCHIHTEQNRGYGSDPLETDEDDDPLDDPLPLEAWAAVHGQQCAGFMIFMRKMCKLPDDRRFMEASRAIDTTQDILFPPDVFIDHHVNGFERQMAKLKKKRRKHE